MPIMSEEQYRRIQDRLSGIVENGGTLIMKGLKISALDGETKITIDIPYLEISSNKKGNDDENESTVKQTGATKTNPARAGGAKAR